MTLPRSLSSSPLALLGSSQTIPQQELLFPNPRLTVAAASNNAVSVACDTVWRREEEEMTPSRCEAW